ncbi:hypothetical protein SMB34_03175 [Thalassospira permensis NBRC 106175]|uniref:Uncharacterized protein n=1 Tax=Thalassospira permensis NBRC 106175 TaxID=1353532 RepID=A0ABR4TQA2_9PROT|nr:hypothetical protein SMB34_03175 [Thalassospira permensis NBRC 106175]
MYNISHHLAGKASRVKSRPQMITIGRVWPHLQQ